MQIPQFIRQTASSLSRASTAPTGDRGPCWSRACSRCRYLNSSDRPRRPHRGQAPLPQAPADPVGAELARDADTSIHQTDRVVLVAGKHCSHRRPRTLLEPSLLAMQIPQFIRQPASSLSRASTAPTIDREPCWSRACSRCRYLNPSDRPRRPYRGQAPLPQEPADPVGAELAREERDTVYLIHRGTCIAGKLAPTDCSAHQTATSYNFGNCTSPVTRL